MGFGDLASGNSLFNGRRERRWKLERVRKVGGNAVASVSLCVHSHLRSASVHNLGSSNKPFRHGMYNGSTLFRPRALHVVPVVWIWKQARVARRMFRSLGVCN